MKLYAFLSRIKFLRSYSSKFLFVAFFGIHIPLIGIIFFVIFHTGDALNPLQVVLYTLALTLAATGATLVVQHRILKPILVANAALQTYVQTRQIPNVPTSYSDEAGMLLQNIQGTMTAFDNLIKEHKELLATLSHDLRTPASNILGLVQLINGHPSSKVNLPFYLENIEQAGQKQLRLMDSVLNLLEEEGTIEEGIQKEKIGLKPFIRAIVFEHQVILNQKELEVSIEIPDKLEVEVAPVPFERVITNLLVNAIKFSLPSQVIHIKAGENEQEQFLTMTDQGIGFKKENAPHLFKRFTRFRRTGTAGEETHGIGLYLCQRIMQQHGGSITAFSEGNGEGATFTVHLPR